MLFPLPPLSSSLPLSSFLLFLLLPSLSFCYSPDTVFLCELLFSACAIGDDFVLELGHGLASNRTLKLLDLAGNVMTIIPDSFVAASQLTVLNLRNCQELVALPHQLYLLTNLTALDLSNTPKLTQIPADKKSSPKAVLDFLASATESIRRINLLGQCCWYCCNRSLGPFPHSLPSNAPTHRSPRTRWCWQDRAVAGHRSWRCAGAGRDVAT